MQQWLFVASSGQQFTANEPDVPALVQSGQIGAQTLMWREGMNQWMPAASVFPQLFAGSSVATQPMVAGPAAGAATVESSIPVATAVAATRVGGYGAGGGGLAAESLVRRLAGPLHQRKGWIKLIGVLSIIGGVFMIPALGLGFIPLFAGLALMKTAASAERAAASGDMNALEEAQRQTAKYFFLTGLFFVLQLVIAVLMVVFMLMTSGAAFYQLNKMQEGGLDDAPTIDSIRFPDTPPAGGNQ